MKAVTVNNLTFGYTETPVLKDVSLEATEGSVLCLLGNNGSGKTTLLDCVLGIHKYPQGQVKIFDNDLMKMPVVKRASHIAYIPQHHDESFPYTVEEIVLMGRNPYLRSHESVKKEDHHLVDQALGVMEIRHLKYRIYSQLSGGEMQMVLFARAYVQDTPVIIMDEPAASLDLKNERLLLKSIEHLVKTDHKTILMSSHSMNHPLFLVKQGLPVDVVMLKEGHIRHVGPVEEVLNEESIYDTYGVRTRMIDYEEDGQKGKMVVTL